VGGRSCNGYLCSSYSELPFHSRPTGHLKHATASDGWNGYGDPLQPHWLSCSTAGPTWARELTDNMPRRARLINVQFAQFSFTYEYIPTSFQLAVSGASVDNRVVYTGVPDFRSQTFSFLNYIAPFPNEVPWNKDNSIFTVSFGSQCVSSLMPPQNPSGL
jgi:hypothetical protein